MEVTAAPPGPLTAPTIPPARPWRRWLRLVVAGGSLAYLGLVAAVISLSRGVGEQHSVTAFLLYLPQQGWLLPLGVLFPLAVLVRPRWCVVQLLGAVAVGWLLMGYVPGRPAAVPPRAAVLTVLTNNRGESNRQSFTSFVQAENPDVLALQDDGRATAFRRAYPEYHAQSLGEFTLVSRHPIYTSGLVQVPSSPRPVAAWFELRPHEVPVVIYSVHLPTPRRDLQALRGTGGVASLLGWAGGSLATRSAQEQQKWRTRIRVAEELQAVLAQERRPYILAGDFNMPTSGYLYHYFAQRHRDAFATVGNGFGFTFPGATRNPLSLFGPWLRLDYLFSSPTLPPVEAKVEPARRSQHRCVVGRFLLPAGSP